MKPTLNSKPAYFAVAVLGAILALSFTVSPALVVAAPATNISWSSSATSQPFVANATAIVNGTVSYNYVGTGTNDTFTFLGGGAAGIFVGTGMGNNYFSVLTGNPATATNSSTFSMMSGANSTFNIVQNNTSGAVAFNIIGGPDSFVNDSSTGPVGSTLFSIILGANSSTNLVAQFSGNQTTINIVS